jgi:hypothetical protein
MGFTRQVRVISERQLMTAAERKIATRYGTLPPLEPRGIDRFWQQVYVPIYHRIPWSVRARVMQLMPGSHREIWHPRPPSQGPAV